MPDLSAVLWVHPGQAVRQGLPDVEGAAPRSVLASPQEVRLGLAASGDDAMKDVERYEATSEEIKRARQALRDYAAAVRKDAEQPKPDDCCLHCVVFD